MNPTLKAYLDKLHAETRAQYAEIHKQLQLQEALFSKFDTRASTPQSAGSAVVTSDGGLNVDATTVAAVPDVSCSTTKAREALEVLPDASLDSIDQTPVTCSTDGLNQVVGTDSVNEVHDAATTVCSEPAVNLNGKEVEQLALTQATSSIGTGASTITEEVVPPMAAKPTPTRCSAEFPTHASDWVKPLIVTTERLHPSSCEHQPWPPPVQVQFSHNGQLFRPSPWPSFRPPLDAYYQEEPCSASYRQSNSMEESSCCLPGAKLQSGRPPDRATADANQSKQASCTSIFSVSTEVQSDDGTKLQPRPGPLFEFNQKTIQRQLQWTSVPGNYQAVHMVFEQYLCGQLYLRVMSMSMYEQFLSQDKLQGSGRFDRECRPEQLTGGSRVRIQSVVLTSFESCSIKCRPDSMLLVRPPAGERTSEEKNSLVRARFTAAYAHEVSFAGYMNCRCTLSKFMRSQGYIVQSTVEIMNLQPTELRFPLPPAKPPDNHDKYILILIKIQHRIFVSLYCVSQSLQLSSAPFEIHLTFLPVDMDPTTSNEAWEQGVCQHLISAGTSFMFDLLILLSCLMAQQVCVLQSGSNPNWLLPTAPFLNVPQLLGRPSLTDSVQHLVIPTCTSIQINGAQYKCLCNNPCLFGKWLVEARSSKNSKLFQLVRAHCKVILVAAVVPQFIFTLHACRPDSCCNTTTYLQLQFLVAIHIVHIPCHGCFSAWKWASSIWEVTVHDVDSGVLLNCGITSMEYLWRKCVIGAMNMPFPITLTSNLYPAGGIIFPSYGPLLSSGNHDQIICLKTTSATYTAVLPDQITPMYSVRTTDVFGDPLSTASPLSCHHSTAKGDRIVSNLAQYPYACFVLNNPPLELEAGCLLADLGMRPFGTVPYITPAVTSDVLDLLNASPSTGFCSRHLTVANPISLHVGYWVDHLFDNTSASDYHLEQLWHPGGFASYLCSTRALTSPMHYLFEVWIASVLSLCIQLGMEKPMTSGELNQWMAIIFLLGTLELDCGIDKLIVLLGLLTPFCCQSCKSMRSGKICVLSAPGDRGSFTVVHGGYWISTPNQEKFQGGRGFTAVTAVFAQGIIDRNYDHDNTDNACTFSAFFDGVFIGHNFCTYITEVHPDFGYHHDSDQVEEHQVQWDPGGSRWHRLEVKPNFKEGGMLGAPCNLHVYVGWPLRPTHGPGPAVHHPSAARYKYLRKRQRAGIQKDQARHGTGGSPPFPLSSTSRSSI